MNGSLTSRPISIILLSVLGAVLGAAVILYHAEATPESHAFILTPGFYVWLFLLIVTTGVLALFLPTLLSALTGLKAYFNGNKVEIGLSCLVMGLLYVVPLLPKPPEGISLLTYQREKLFILLGLGLVVVLLAMMGILLVNAALRIDFKQVRPDPSQIARLKKLWALLQRFLYVLGLLISLVTLANGAQRYAILAAGVIEESKYPLANILVWGAYYTVMVALAYIPTYLLGREVGKRIVEAYFPVDCLTQESVSAWCSGRKNLEAFLNIEAGIMQNLQAGIVIFSPLLSGIIAVLLGS